MHVIEITESKVEHLADNIGKMLHYGGMAMHCVEEMRRDGYLGERGGYGRYGMREHEMPHHDGYEHDHMGERYPIWDEDPYMMGERRGRSAYTGRYIRR